METAFGTVNNVGAYLDKILTWAMSILGGLAVLVIIYAGIIYISSQGQPEKIKLAHQLVTGVIVGVLLLFLIGALVAYIVPR